MRRPFVGKSSWWWVFALFIALPAVALTVLGVRALRADEIEARQRIREQQAQIARLVDAALSTAFERESASLHAFGRSSSPPGILFEVDELETLSFPDERVYITRSGVEPPAQASVVLSTETQTLIESAQSADAQGRTSDAVKLYAQLRTVPALRAWADLQLAVLRSGGLPAMLQTAAVDIANSADRSPAGIPVAMVAASFSGSSC